MAERRIRSPKTGTVLTESQLYDLAVKADPAMKGQSPAQVADLYLQQGYTEEGADWVPTPQAEPPAAAGPAPEQKSVSGFLGNLGRSGLATVAGVVQPILHPVETAQGLATLGRGLAFDQFHPELKDSQAAQAAQGFKEYIANRIQHPLEAAYQDPVGMALDASALLGGTGMMMRGAGAVTGAARLANAGRKVQMVSEAVNPLIGPARLLKKTPPVREFGRRLYGNAMEIPKSTLEEMDRAVDMGIKKELKPTRKDLARAREMVDTDANAIQGAVAELERQGEVVRGNEIVNGLIELRKQYEKGPFQSEQKRIDDLIKEFTAKHGTGDITPTKAWEMRRQAYREIEDKGAFGRALESAPVEAKEAVIKAINQQLYNPRNPALKGYGETIQKLGTETRDLIDTRTAIEQRLMGIYGGRHPSEHIYAAASGLNTAMGNFQPYGAAVLSRWALTAPARARIGIRLAGASKPHGIITPLTVGSRVINLQQAAKPYARTTEEEQRTQTAPPSPW